MSPIICGRNSADLICRFFSIPVKHIVIAGGALLSNTPKDIDVILENYDGDPLRLEMRWPLCTRFGGARFPAIDIWRLEDSDCFKRHPEWDVTLENFLRQVPEGKPTFAYRAGTDSMVEVVR